MRQLSLAWLILALMTAPVAAQTNLVIGNASYHAARTDENGQQWNEGNTGAGLETSISRRWYLITGAYQDSYRKVARYAGAYYQIPVTSRIGFVSINLMAGAMKSDGYWQGRPAAVIWPALEISGAHAGVNIIFVPKRIARDSKGVVIAQFKIKLAGL